MLGKRSIKNLMFLLLIGFGFVFWSEGVYAVGSATCEYVFDASNIRSAPTAKEVQLTMNVGSDSTLVFSSATLVWKDGTSEEIVVTTPYLKDLVVENSSCPSLYLYYGEWNGDWKVFANQERCDEDRWGNCPRDCFSELTYGKPFGMCGDMEVQAYNTQVSKINTSLTTLFNNKKRDIQSIPIENASISQDRTMTEEYERHMNEFNNTRIQLGSQIGNEADVYGCARINEEASKVMDEFERQADIYFSQLKTIWETKTNKGITIREASGDSEGVASLKHYQQNASQQVEQFDERFQQNMENFKEPLKIDFGSIVDSDCEAVLGDILDLIQKAFDIIKIAAPILLIFFGSLDFAKAVIAGDDKATKKATSDFMKRAIAAILIFFIPFFIELIFSLPGVELGIKDILCGVSKVVK